MSTKTIPRRLHGAWVAPQMDRSALHHDVARPQQPYRAIIQFQFHGARRGRWRSRCCLSDASATRRLAACRRPGSPIRLAASARLHARAHRCRHCCRRVRSWLSIQAQRRRSAGNRRDQDDLIEPANRAPRRIMRCDDPPDRLSYAYPMPPARTTRWSIVPNSTPPSGPRASIRTRSPKRMKEVFGAPSSSISIARRSAMQDEPTTR